MQGYREKKIYAGAKPNRGYRRPGSTMIPFVRRFWLFPSTGTWQLENLPFLPFLSILQILPQFFLLQASL
jgi:hypothetical protein